MLGRLFGRAKDNHDDTICSSCGRTLLAGEWTQRTVAEDGSERFICSLCSPPEGSSGSPLEPADEMATVTNGRVKPVRTESDAFWRALKDKDAEIEHLESRLARAEAEKQELAAQLARLRNAYEPAVASDAGAETGETAAAVPLAAATEPAIGDGFDAAPLHDEAAPLAADAARANGEAVAATAAAADAFVSATSLDHTDPSLGEALRRAAEPAGAATESFTADELAAHGETPGEPGDQASAMAPFDGDPDDTLIGEAPAASGAGQDAPAAEPAAGEPPARADEPDDDELIPLTILQRGVDLLNVSAVPKRIVETNENLGMPQVHVGSQGESTLLVTFMWSMGWYQFRVELAEAGRISLADRGYEERVDLRPNASVRADGTVQLAPSRIKPPTPKDTSEGKPAGVTSGVIISKSMMGQRTDDENVPADWKSQRAPDFDWGR
jgi:hypothetical protein